MQLIYYVLVTGLLCTGVLLLLDSFVLKPAPAPVLKDRTTQLREQIFNKKSDPVFERAGIRLSVKRYKMFCLLIVSVMLLFSFLKVIKGDLTGCSKTLLLALLFYVLTTPREHYNFGKKIYKTPFGAVLDMLYARRLDAMDTELASVISQMRNLIVSWSGQSRSAEYILSRLLPYTKLTRPVFLQTQSLIIQGQYDAAAEIFASNFRTKLAKDFSRVLPKLDRLPLEELLEQLNILMSNASVKRETRKEQKLQQSKMIIFLLASLELILIIGDFVYIVLYDCMAMMTLSL